MKANEVIKGKYSMLTEGFEFDDVRNIYKPIASLAVVSYDGSTDQNGAGVVYGAGVAKFPRRSALVGDPAPDQEPIGLAEFTILPYPRSKYWIDEPEQVTGRAVFAYALHDGSHSMLHYYFVLEHKEDGKARKIKFVLTDARYYDLSDPDTAPLPPQSTAVLWGTQTKISDVLAVSPPHPAGGGGGPRPKVKKLESI